MFESKYLFLFLFITIAGSFFSLQELNEINIESHEYFSFQDSIVSDKTTALIVLQNKCNACHLQENKSKVFTLENMDEHAKRINKQVFIKKNMPKDDVTLNEEEYHQLKNWLIDVLSLAD